MGKPLLEFLEGGDNTHLLTAEEDKFINIRLNNIIKTFNENGDLTVENKYYDMKLCQEENFKNNDFETAYWEYAKDSRSQYCVVDPNDDIFL